MCCYPACNASFCDLTMLSPSQPPSHHPHPLLPATLANEDSLSEVWYTNVLSSFSFSFLFVFCLSFVSSHPGRLSKNCSIVERGPLPPTTSSHHSTFPDLQRPTAGSPFSPALSLTLPSHSPSPSPSSAGDVSSCDSPLQLLRNNSDFPIRVHHAHQQHLVVAEVN